MRTSDPEPRSDQFGQHLMTLGKFAKLCNTSRETLYHYEERGIFKPYYTAENGYRYYSPNQIYAFNVISSLRFSGASVDDIAEYLATPDKKVSFIQLAEHLMARLRKDEEAIAQKRDFLIREMLQTATGYNHELGHPTVADSPETTLVVTAEDVSAAPTFESFNLLVADHFEHCRQIGLVGGSPAGITLFYQSYGDGASALNRCGTFSTAYNVTDSIARSDRLYRRPAGKTLFLAFNGPLVYGTLDKELAAYLKAAKDLGLEVIGDIFSTVIFSYLNCDYANEPFTREYSALVRSSRD